MEEHLRKWVEGVSPLTGIHRGRKKALLTRDVLNDLCLECKVQLPQIRESIFETTMPDTSQEVWDDLADRNGARTVLCSVEDLELPIQVLIDVQNGGNVAAAVDVVWSRPDCYQV